LLVALMVTSAGESHAAPRLHALQSGDDNKEGSTAGKVVSALSGAEEHLQMSATSEKNPRT
jgi:hypothetical protein